MREADAREGNVSMNILLDIQRSVKRLDRKFDSIHKTVRDLKKDNKYLKDQNENLTKKSAGTVYIYGRTGTP